MKPLLKLCIAVLFCIGLAPTPFPAIAAIRSTVTEQKEQSQVPSGGKNGYTVPKCIKCPIPSYTDEAFKAKTNGEVQLSVVVSTDGRAHDIRVTKSLGHGLDKRAVKTVRDKWRFKPAKGPDGKPAAVRMLIELTFSIH